MIFSKEIPQIFERIKAKFNVKWENGIAIAYGDTVYSIKALPPDLEVHESVHLSQQRVIGVEEWWDRYLEDRDFRLVQEIPAYKAQIKFLQESTEVGREYKRWKLGMLPKDLSSPIYGNMISYKLAKKLLFE